MILPEARLILHNLSLPLVVTMASSVPDFTAAVMNGTRMGFDVFNVLPSKKNNRSFPLNTNLFFSQRLILLNVLRSEEHTSELQSLMRISYAVFCLKKKT